jgi:hypothetical protein
MGADRFTSESWLMDQEQRAVPDWAAIRYAYEDGSETVMALCQRFGITRWQLERRQRTEGWPGRRPSRQQRYRAALAGLFQVLEQQVARMAAGEKLGDRETQQLGDLIKNYEKMTSFDTEATKTEAAPPPRDIAELRSKLAKRIDQFRRR